MRTKTHDAVDALVYLDRALPLDWLNERLSEFFADADGDILPDSVESDFLAALVSARESIQEQARLHYDGRRCYSTGVPFERIALCPSSEPGPDGDDVPVITQYHVQLHPNGTPSTPPSGGVWADEELR